VWFSADFFFDPWVGGDVVLNPQTVSLDAFDHDPFPVQGEVSVKFGWFTPI